jgi:hypothetical protein
MTAPSGLARATTLIRQAPPLQYALKDTEVRHSIGKENVSAFLQGDLTALQCAQCAW